MVSDTIERIIRLCEKMGINFPLIRIYILNLLREKEEETALVKARPHNKPLFQRAFRYPLFP